MFDIDFFKKVNDNFGHLVGDQVLKELARLIQSQLRTSDLLFRFGGEEFIVVLPQQDAQTALSIAEKIRVNVASYEFTEAGHISVSLGVTQYHQGEHLNEVLTRADAALYQAKSSDTNNTQLIEK